MSKCQESIDYEKRHNEFKKQKKTNRNTFMDAKKTFHTARVTYITNRIQSYQDMTDNLNKQLLFCKNNTKCMCMLEKHHDKINLKLKKSKYQDRLKQMKALLISLNQK